MDSQREAGMVMSNKLAALITCIIIFIMGFFPGLAGQEVANNFFLAGFGGIAALFMAW